MYYTHWPNLGWYPRVMGVCPRLLGCTQVVMDRYPTHLDIYSQGKGLFKSLIVSKSGRYFPGYLVSWSLIRVAAVTLRDLFSSPLMLPAGIVYIASYQNRSLHTDSPWSLAQMTAWGHFVYQARADNAEYLNMLKESDFRFFIARGYGLKLKLHYEHILKPQLMKCYYCTRSGFGENAIIRWLVRISQWALIVFGALYVTNYWK